MRTARSIISISAIAMLCSGCISFYHEPKADISAIDNNLPAASKGDAQSQLQLAMAFGGQQWKGRGVGIDSSASQRYLISAAEKNNVPAQIELGRRYFNGIIGGANGRGNPQLTVEQDYDAAMYWLYRAARQRNANAYQELRVVYERQGTPLFDLVEACKWAILQYPATNYCEQKKLTPEQVLQARRSAGDWLSNN